MGWLRQLVFGRARSTFVPISYIEKLDLKPGDVVVLQVDGILTREQADRMKAMLQDRLADGVKALIHESTSKLTVIRAPHTEAV